MAVVRYSRTQARDAGAVGREARIVVPDADPIVIAWQGRQVQLAMTDDAGQDALMNALLGEA